MSKVMNTLFFFILFFATHAWAVQEKTIHVEGRMSSTKSWMEYSSSQDTNLRKLFELLSRSEAGDKLIKEAQQKAARTGFLLIQHLLESFLRHHQSMLFMSQNLSFLLIGTSHGMMRF
jgi:hypothetical protein